MLVKAPTHGSGEQNPNWPNRFLKQGVKRRSGPESSAGGPRRRDYMSRVCPSGSDITDLEGLV